MTKKVLIVDNDIDLLQLVRHRLSNLGYSIMTSSEGLDAIRVATEEKPDVILLDIMIPGADGTEVARTLRKSSATKDIPVIFMTALKDVEESILGEELSNCSVLTKPIDPDNLMLKIAELVNS